MISESNFEESLKAFRQARLVLTDFVVLPVSAMFVMR